MNKDRIFQGINDVEETLRDAMRDAQEKIERLRAEVRNSAENPGDILMEDGYENSEADMVQGIGDEAGGWQEETRENPEDGMAGDTGGEVGGQQGGTDRRRCRREACKRVHDGVKGVSGLLPCDLLKEQGQ